MAFAVLCCIKRKCIFQNAIYLFMYSNSVLSVYKLNGLNLRQIELENLSNLIPHLPPPT